MGASGRRALGPCPLLCPRITGARVSEKLDFSTVAPRSARLCVYETQTRGGENKGGGVGEAVIKTRMLITLCIVIARLAMRARALQTNPPAFSSLFSSFHFHNTTVIFRLIAYPLSNRSRIDGIGERCPTRDLIVASYFQRQDSPHRESNRNDPL